jgi:hypothetical protein
VNVGRVHTELTKQKRNNTENTEKKTEQKQGRNRTGTKQKQNRNKTEAEGKQNITQKTERTETKQEQN